MEMPQLREALHNTQVIGISKLAEEPKFGRRWLIWGCVILGAVTCCAVHLTWLTLRYLKRETTMTTEMTHVDFFPFPQVEFVLSAYNELHQNYLFHLDWCSLRIKDNEQFTCSYNSTDYFEFIYLDRNCPHYLFNSLRNPNNHSMVDKNQTFRAQFSLTRVNKSAPCVLEYITLHRVAALAVRLLSPNFAAVDTTMDTGFNREEFILRPNFETFISLDVSKVVLLPEKQSCMSEYPAEFERYIHPQYYNLPYETTTCGRVCDDLANLERCSCISPSYGLHIYTDAVISYPACNESNCPGFYDPWNENPFDCQQVCKPPCSSYRYRPIVKLDVIADATGMGCDTALYIVYVSGPPGGVINQVLESYVYDWTQFATDVVSQLNFYLCISLAVLGDTIELILSYLYQRRTKVYTFTATEHVTPS